MNLFSRLLTVRSRLESRLFSYLIASAFHEFGAKSVISPPFRFANLSQIAVEDRVLIHSNCWIHALNGDSTDRGVKLIIKSGAGIGMGATISAIKKITIGKHALLARNVYISDHGHSYRDINRPIVEQGIANVKEVEIGDNCWIGQNACILPGVKLGRHCIVGANSVVTKSVPDYTVIAGAPALPVRQYDHAAQDWLRTCAQPL